MATIPISLSVDPANPAELKSKVALLNKLQSAGVSLATFTNVAATTVISFRILTVFYSVRNSIDRQRAKTYTGVVAILVESAAPCAILGIVYAVCLPQPSSNIDVWNDGLFFIWSASLVSLVFLEITDAF
jgi:hypothetical protein